MPQVRYSFQRGFVTLQELPNIRLMNSQEKLQWEFDASITNPILDSMITNRKASGAFPATATLFNLTGDQRQGIWDLAASRGAGDWRNFYLQNAKTESHEVSISGATDKMKYFFSLNKFDEDGLVYRNYRNRIGARIVLLISKNQQHIRHLSFACLVPNFIVTRKIHNAIFRLIFYPKGCRSAAIKIDSVFSI